jgi:hypothetical protein
MDQINIKNKGLNLELEKAHRQETDWIFGAASVPCIAQIPQEERGGYLPLGEVQKGVEDMMDCASRGPANILEAKFTWLVQNGLLSIENMNWLINNAYVEQARKVRFSDCFVAQNSNTTRQGNSLIAPLEAIRKQGLIPKHMMPLEPWMRWADYHNPARITPAIRALGMEFASRFLINYERVLEADFEKVYEQDMIDMAGYAWPEPIDGEYPRTNNQPNHVFVGLYAPKHWVFDNYEETKGDFIKKLAPDYDLLDYGYRLIISENPKVENPPIKKSFWEKMSESLALKKDDGICPRYT